MKVIVQHLFILTRICSKKLSSVRDVCNVIQKIREQEDMINTFSVETKEVVTRSIFETKKKLRLMSK